MKISDIINEAMSDDDRKKLRALQRRGGEYTKLARLMEPYLQQGEDWDVAAELAKQKAPRKDPTPPAQQRDKQPAQTPKKQPSPVSPKGPPTTSPRAPTKKPDGDGKKDKKFKDKVKDWIKTSPKSIPDLIAKYGEQSAFK